jgi:hypothetical protein
MICCYRKQGGCLAALLQLGGWTKGIVYIAIEIDAGKKTGGFFRHLYIKVIFLPRQARDKHRESTQKKMPFSQIVGGLCGTSVTITAQLYLLRST